MSKFTSIQDMSDCTLILNSLREIAHHFHQAILGQATSEVASLSTLSLADEVYKSAVDVLHPLAFYLQNRAEELQKEKLSEMLADSEAVEYLCEEVIDPYVKGISSSIST